MSQQTKPPSLMSLPFALPNQQVICPSPRIFPPTLPPNNLGASAISTSVPSLMSLPVQPPNNLFNSPYPLGNVANNAPFFTSFETPVNSTESPIDVDDYTEEDGTTIESAPNAANSDLFSDLPKPESLKPNDYNRNLLRFTVLYRYKYIVQYERILCIYLMKFSSL